MLKSSTFLVYDWICWVSCFTCCTKQKKYVWKSDFTHLFICIPPAVLAPLVIKWYSMQVPLNLGFLLQHKPLAGINLSSSLQLTVKIENRSERMIFVFTLFITKLFVLTIFFIHIFPNIYFKSRWQHPCAAHKRICESVWLWRWIVSVLCVNGLLKAPLDRWFTKVRGETDMWTTPSILYSAAWHFASFQQMHAVLLHVDRCRPR